jgi:hypothetical protein
MHDVSNILKEDNRLLLVATNKKRLDAVWHLTPPLPSGRRNSREKRKMRKRKRGRCERKRRKEETTRGNGNNR